VLCNAVLGIISREDAETQLRDKWVGSFLVRVSDKIWGYVISYRYVDESDGTSVKFKHFLIDADTNGYRLLGAADFVHNSLNDLVEYHSVRWCTVQHCRNTHYSILTSAAEQLRIFIVINHAIKILIAVNCVLINKKSKQHFHSRNN